MADNPQNQQFAWLWSWRATTSNVWKTRLFVAFLAGAIAIVAAATTGYLSGHAIWAIIISGFAGVAAVAMLEPFRRAVTRGPLPHREDPWKRYGLTVVAVAVMMAVSIGLGAWAGSAFVTAIVLIVGLPAAMSVITRGEMWRAGRGVR